MEKQYEEISLKIIRLAENDDKLRNELIKKRVLADTYNEDMKALHSSNSRKLKEIIEKIGFPTEAKVGEKAFKAACLIIQHSIAEPRFMKYCKNLLEKALSDSKSEALNLAYLSDRIAVFEGRAQLYGTQFDWDSNGLMKPNKFDDLAKVNQRRKDIGLNTLEEQTQIMQARIETENQQPPKDLEERNRVFDEWRRSVGWIK